MLLRSFVRVAVTEKGGSVGGILLPVVFLPQVSFFFTNWWGSNQLEVASFDGQNLNARIAFIRRQRE